eukprot:CAMPEP_0176005644 /NCGR_PEP_ID=MMETSP0120_2-20121206/2313_1 /TAXON_ID=160619 /ORGANISM="Kryptoperidinium foliaceum, Strain CCMP 1326" /LENGTH=140 /DNA_ID=CAMNT_0017338359 /DNA_START=82 /DNA_END=504 /DNA_ORIENTATION=+
MKLSILSAIVGLAACVQGFVPTVPSTTRAPSSLLAKYNSMDEILAKFPEDKPVLINFYDASTEDAIKGDIFRAKELLKDRATLVSIKQQDYPELAAKWDCNTKSPAMILFQDGKPVARLYEETHYLEIVAKFGQYCNSSA